MNILKKIVLTAGVITVLSVSTVFAADINVALQIPISGTKSVQVCLGDFCAGIGEYISLIYQWGVAFAAILAVLAFTYAGVLWLIAGGDSGKVTESKKVMGSSLLGLLLALGSYVLLNTINPDLVQFQPIHVPTVKTIALNLTPASITAGGITVNYSVDRFTKLGFPPPNTEEFETGPKPPLEGAALTKWKELLPIASDVATKTGVDVGFIGMWMWLETAFDPLAENCGDTDSNPNTPCSASLWQVGFNQYSDVIGRIEDDMMTMHGSKSDDQMRAIGKSVLAKLRTRKHPLTIINDADFDSATFSSIINGAKRGNAKARAMLTTLMKDEKIGIYEIGVHFRDEWDFTTNTHLAQDMDGWIDRTKVPDPKKRYYNPQKISNLIKAVYDAK